MLLVLEKLNTKKNDTNITLGDQHACIGCGPVWSSRASTISFATICKRQKISPTIYGGGWSLKGGGMEVISARD